MPALWCIPNVEPTTQDPQRRRRLLIFGGVLAAAIVVVAIVIAVSSGGGSGDKNAAAPAATSKSAGLRDVGRVQAEFAGIPQSGNTLGNPKAPATLMVFADLQCPFCAQFENNALPSIVQKYVKPGKLKVVFQPIVILGNDSILGARAAAAAGQQSKLFQFAATLYRNQGEENTGYLNEAYVKKIAAGVSGLDVQKLMANLKSPAVNKLLNSAQSTATSGKVSSTPSFFAAKTGQPLQQVQVTSLDAAAFYKTLDSITS